MSKVLLKFIQSELNALTTVLDACNDALVQFVIRAGGNELPSELLQAPLRWLGAGAAAVFTLQRWVTRPSRGRASLHDSHGAARFARRAEALAPSSELRGQCALGTVGRSFWRPFDRPCRIGGHIVTLAPTGAGKSIGCAIPNLWSFAGSAVVLDLKGELFHATGTQRTAPDSAVHVVDPFGVTETPTMGFNPLAQLDASGPDAVSEATLLAEALVVRDARGADTYWDDAAADLLKGLMLFVVSSQHIKAPTLSDVRALLTQDKMHLLGTFEAMAESGHEAVARCGRSMLGKHERELSAVMSSAQRHTDFLDDPCIARTLHRNEVCFSSLKDRPTTVYLVLPPHKLALYRRWLRLALTVALSDMTRSPRPGRCPVLFLLDEFPKLGPMACVEEGFSIMRGYGVQFWILAQDLSQLRLMYPGWQTFLANATLQCFGIQDLETAKYVSDLLGQCTGRSLSSQRSRSHASGRNSSWGHSLSSGSSPFGRPLMSADELRLLPDDAVLVFVRGRRPLLLRRLNVISKLKRLARQRRRADEQQAPLA